MYKSCHVLASVSAVLSSIGAINWGLIAAFNFNLVAYLLGQNTTPSKLVYALVGLSGIFTLIFALKCICSPCPHCCKEISK